MGGKKAKRSTRAWVDAAAAVDLSKVHTIDDVDAEVVAHVFQRDGKHHKHKNADGNCGSPNCLTGLNEGSGPVFDLEARDALLRELSSESEDPRSLVREPGAPPTTGLRNLGATCFMNSLFQALFATAPFREGLFQFRAPDKQPQNESLESFKKKKSVIEQMQLLFARMDLGAEKWLRPDIFPKLLDFPTGEQQDVQEFFMLLLAQYCDTCFQMCKDTQKLFSSLFGGHLQIQMQCAKEKHVSVRKELWYVLQLPLMPTIRESLEAVIQPEVLDDDNLYACGACNERVPAVREARLLGPLPPILVLQVTRFLYDLSKKDKVKKLQKVSAPRFIDMRPFMADNGKGVEENDAYYELYAILCHIGNSAHGGHYVAHVKLPSGAWVEVDDEETRLLKEEEVGMTIAMRTGAESRKNDRKKKKQNDDDFDFVDDDNADHVDDVADEAFVPADDDVAEYEKDEYVAQDDGWKQSGRGKRRKRAPKNEVAKDSSNGDVKVEKKEETAKSTPDARATRRPQKKKMAETKPGARTTKDGRSVAAAEADAKAAAAEAAQTTAEFLLYNTRGSSAPYLLFYRRQKNDWNTTEYQLPEFISSKVARLNEEFANRVSNYREIADGAMERITSLEELYDLVTQPVEPLVVGKGKEPYVWIATEWLKHWLSAPHSEEVAPIDNGSILCEHQGLSPSSARSGDAKRISRRAWDALVGRYTNAGNVLNGDECECHICTIEFCRDAATSEVFGTRVTWVKNELRLQSKTPIKASAKDYYYMSKLWLTTWKRKPSSGPDELDETINSSILCPHNELVPDENEFVRVSADVWEFFKDLWPNALEVPKKVGKCKTCQEEMHQKAEERESILQERAGYKRTYANLLDRKRPTVLDKLQCGPYNIVAVRWINQLQSFLNDPEVKEIEAPNNTSLFCEQHGLLKVRLDSELRASPNDKSVQRAFYAISTEEWGSLMRDFGRGGNVRELVIDVFLEGVQKNYRVSGKKSLEQVECHECIATAEEEAAKSRPKEIEIRISSNEQARSTNNRGPYQLRAGTQKRAGRATRGSSSAAESSTFRIPAEETDSIETIKMRIYQEREIEPFEQRLSFNGKILGMDEMSLAQYEVLPNAVLDLRIITADGVDDFVDLDTSATASNASSVARNRRPEKGFAGSALLGDFAGSSASSEHDDHQDEKRTPEPVGIPCSACTFLNVGEMTVCEMCDNELSAKKAKMGE